MKLPTDSGNCLAAALRILARRDHSCWEITQKLTDRGFSRDQVQWALSECLRLQYLDDGRIADMWARQLQRKGYGCHRIREKLLGKGLDGKIVASCLDNYCSQNVQTRICRQAMEKKLKGALSAGSPENSLKNRAKLYRFLFNRGFSPAIIRQVMEEAVD